MKFLTFTVMDVTKAAEVAQANDKVWASPPAGLKLLASYVCQGMPFPSVPPNTLTAIAIVEAESNEALAAANYPVALAGASVHTIPMLELPVAGAAGVEKKYRG